MSNVEDTNNSSDLSEFFSALSKEKKESRQKLEEQIANPESGLSNLFQQLEEAHRETQKVSEEIPDSKSLSPDDQNKLEAFSSLMNSVDVSLQEVQEETPEGIETVEPVVAEVFNNNSEKEDEKLEVFSKLFDGLAQVEEKQEPQEELVIEGETPKPQIVAQETNDIISDVISNLDAMESKTEVKEEVDQITSIRAEFEKFKTHIQQHISNQGLSGGGSGETRVEFLDDVDRDTAKVNGKALVYNSSAGKWKGESVLTGAITGLDIDGGTDIGADLADADLIIVDDGAGGTNRKSTLSRLKTYIGAGAADDLVAGDAAVTLTTTSGNITIDAAANNSDIIFKGTDGGSDITMLTLDGSAAGAATFNDKIIATELDISGDVDIDGTLEADAITVNGASLAETISDTVGAMVGSNTETGITVTYQDGDNTLDFALAAAQTTITSLLATDIKIGEDDQTKIDFETADEIHFYAANEHQIKLVDGALVPVTDNDIDLGTSSVEFKDAYFDGTVTADAFAGPLTGNVTGNASGTAATVTGAAQTNITSLGTLTALTVDNVVINGATIGHGDDTDLITVADGIVTVAGEVSMTSLDIGGTNVTSTAAELNALDGITAVVGELNALDIGSTAVGTAVASKAVILDSNKDYTGIRNFTVSGELDAATGDFSGAVDIAGDLTLSGGADGALTFGSTSSVKFGDNAAASLVFEEADNAYMTFVTTNSSEAVKFDKALDINAAVQIDATLTVGVNDTGYDVKLFGATDGAHILWDASDDALETVGGATINIVKDKLKIGGTAVTTTAAELNLLDTASANSVVNSKAVIYGSSGELAGTLSTAAQTSVTSLGTLTALTVDDVAVNGKAITMTGSSSDTAVFTVGTHGTLSIVTTDDAAAAANIQITADGSAELAGTTVTLDSGGNIVLDADGGTITFADAGSSLGTITSSGYSGTAAVATTVTITDNESTNENNAIIFTAGGDVDGGDLGLESDGDLTYNPSTGTLSVTNIVVSGTQTITDSVTMNANNAVVFEGATADAHETTLTSVDATGDRTISLPNVSGTLPVLAAASTTQITSTPEELNILDGATVVVGEINALDLGSTAVGTAIASKAVILDSSKDYSGIRNLTISGEIDAATGDFSGAVDVAGATTTAAITASGIIKTDDATEATSTTDGSLQTDGGLSVVKDAVFGDDVKLLSDAAVIGFGADGDVTLTHVADTGVLLNAAMVVQFRDSAINIGSPADGDLDINADDEIELNSTLIDVNGNLDVSGTGVIAGAVTTAALTASGIIKTDDTTAATSTTDGSLQTDGGLSVAADAVIGDDLFLLSDSAVLTFGADKDVTLTHVHNTGILLNSTMAIQFNDASQSINAPSNAILDINATDEIELNATLLDVNANINASGTYTGAGTMTTGGNIVIPDAGTIGSASDTDAIAIGSDGDVTLTQDLELQHDGAILSFGANDDVTLTHVHNTGLLLNAAMVVQFRDSAINIGSPADGDLDINADDEIELNSTLIDINGNVEISGTLAQADAITMATNKKIIFRDTAIHISSTADGDLAIAADDEIDLTSTLIDVNGNLDVSGTYQGGGTMTTGGNIVIPDAGTIGSASDTDAIAIGSDGDVTLTQDLELQHDGAILSFGANDDVTLTHVHNTGLLLNAAMVVQFRDSAINIGSPADGDLDINADDEVEINSTLIDVNGNLDVSGTIVGASTLSATTGTFSGVLKTDDATEATSTTDGSLQTDGGLSVVKDAVFGDDVKLLSDSSVIALGADGDVTITHVADTGIALNTKSITGVTSVNSGALGGRRNVIHNPNGAVNQRHGTAANVDMNTYAMDRWRSFGGGTGYGQSFLSGSDAGEGDGYYIRYQRPQSNSTTFATGIAQGLETVDSKHLAGKTVTLSFRARGGADWSPTSGSATFRVVGGEGTDQSPVGMTTAENAFTVTANIPQNGDFVTYSGTGTIPADKTQIAIQIAWTWTGTAGAADYIDIRNLQLEIGSTATTFEQLSYGEELHRCQRYCFVARPPTNTALATGFARTTTTVHCVKALPVTMRTTPSLAFSSATDFQVQFLGSVATTTAMAASELGPDTMAFQASVSSGLTAGQGMYVRDLNGGATITAAAEL